MEIMFTLKEINTHLNCHMMKQNLTLVVISYDIY